MEIGLVSILPFLGESQKEMCKRLEELQDFRNCEEVISNMPEKALENYRDA
jgi:hypothetical protein